MVALHDISLNIPSFKKTIYNGIVQVLSLVLISQATPQSTGVANSSATVGGFFLIFLFVLFFNGIFYF